MSSQIERTQTDVDHQTVIDDPFFHFIDYVYRQRKLFITLGVLVLLGVFSILGWLEYQQKLDKTRDLLLYKMESELRIPATQPKALADLQSFVAQHPSSNQAKLARLYRANVLSAHGESLKAEFELDHLLEEVDPKSGFYVIVQVNLANLLRDQGKFKDALEVLGKNKGLIMEDALLIEKAEIYFSQKNIKETRNTLNRLLEAYPNSLYKQRADQLLNVL